MIQQETAVEGFFEAFQRQSNSDDIPSMISHFAETFLVAGPQGAQCMRSTDFAAVLPKRKQLFERLGCQPATLVALQQTPLDARYVIAKTTWRLDFARGNAGMEEVFVDSTYLLDTGSPEFKIILYLTHQDIMQILRERAILQE
jgi:hypothetical protein